MIWIFKSTTMAVIFHRKNVCLSRNKTKTLQIQYPEILYLKNLKIVPCNCFSQMFVIKFNLKWVSQPSPPPNIVGYQRFIYHFFFISFFCVCPYFNLIRTFHFIVITVGGWMDDVRSYALSVFVVVVVVFLRNLSTRFSAGWDGCYRSLSST